MANIRPGLFGLVAFGFSLMVLVESLSGEKRALNSAPNVGASQLSTPRQTEQPEPSPEQEYTYIEYELDTDLANLEQLVKNRALEILENGSSQEQINNALHNLKQNWEGKPEQVVERLGLNRARQTLIDDDPRPDARAIANPTLEGYKEALNEQ